MKKPFLILVVVVALSSLIHVVADDLLVGRWRYRITVIVDTPEGEKTGSAVWEVLLRPKRVENSIGYDESIRGEAVAIDLGKRGYLMALMRGPNRNAYVRQLAYWMFPFVGDYRDDQARVKFYNNLEDKAVELPRKYYPLIVLLKDVDAPKNAELVFESYFKGKQETDTPYIDRTQEVFGKSVEIRKVSIEMTKDPVEYKLHKTLEWLDAGLKGRLKEKPALARSGGLRYSDFQKGRNK